MVTGEKSFLERRCTMLDAFVLEMLIRFVVIVLTGGLVVV
jgi:hypothetical protein